jgi:uncharacterized protein YoxC
MQLLTILTLIYAAVLVVALAASLITILVYLRRIATTLGEAHAALAAVRKETEPLAQHLQPVHDAIADSAQELAHAQQQIDAANEHLTTLLERQGVSERAG